MSNRTPILTKQYTMHKVLSTLEQERGLSFYKLNLFISLYTKRANNKQLAKSELMKYYAKVFGLTYGVVAEHIRSLLVGNYLNNDLSLGVEGVRLKTRILSLYKLEAARD